MEKTIDANIQGSTIQFHTEQKNDKKLYIESYGCQ